MLLGRRSYGRLARFIKRKRHRSLLLQVTSHATRRIVSSGFDDSHYFITFILRVEGSPLPLFLFQGPGHGLSDVFVDYLPWYSRQHLPPSAPDRSRLVVRSPTPPGIRETRLQKSLLSDQIVRAAQLAAHLPAVNTTHKFVVQFTHSVVIYCLSPARATYRCLTTQRNASTKSN